VQKFGAEVAEASCSPITGVEPRAGIRKPCGERVEYCAWVPTAVEHSRNIASVGLAVVEGFTGGSTELPQGTVNLSNPRAIFAGSPPRFTRSRVTYEA
jgi:hypothetical protein